MAGDSGNIDEWSITVYYSAPNAGPPTALSPGTATDTGYTISGLTPQCTWTSVSGATSYGLYLSKSPYGQANVVYSTTGLTGTSHTIPSGYLVEGTKYRWQMTSFTGSAESAGGNLLYFQTQAPNAGPPTALSPGTATDTGFTVATLTPSFEWTGGAGAARYGLYISRYPYGQNNSNRPVKYV